MKNTFFFLIVLLSCTIKASAQVTFSGTLYNSPAQTVYLINVYGKKVDSAFIDPTNPRFTLKADVTEETFFNMSYPKKGPFILNQFVVMPGEHIKFSYDVENTFQNHWIDVSGSPFTFERISLFKKIVSNSLDRGRNEKAVDSIRNGGRDTNEIVARQQRINQDNWQTNLVELQLFDTTKSVSNAGLAFRGLIILDVITQIQKDSLLQIIKKRFPNSKHVQGLTTSVSNPANQGLSITSKAPNIVLKGPDGSEVDVNKLDYRYLLIDFWASWCSPCRIESPYLTKAFNKFKEKGFRIFSLSIDTDIDKWKKAINTDSTSSFIQVIDVKGSNSEYLKLYQISSIPANFLIDKHGRIIAKNLRDDELYKELEKLTEGN